MNYFRSSSVEGYANVSFDIFDTLITRNVKDPVDVFSIVEKHFNSVAEMTDFANRRVEAESLARKKCRNEEITLDEIYDNIAFENEMLKDEVKRCEVNTEIDVCVPIEKNKRLFENLIKNGKSIYIVSDMYLPESVIKTILIRCGYPSIYKLYVSSEYGLTKITGNLFKYILKENSIQGDEIIHIGDSIKADIIGAHKAGIRALLVGRKNRLWRKICRWKRKFLK